MRRLTNNIIEHRLGQGSGKGVLLARVIRAHHVDRASIEQRDRRLDPVTELWRLRSLRRLGYRHGQIASRHIVSELTKY